MRGKYLNERKSSHVVGDDLPVMFKHPENLVQALEDTVKKFPEKGIIYMDANQVERKISYSQLLLNARRIGMYLEQKGINTNDALILSFDEHDVFFCCLWGSIVKEIVPVSITLPLNPAFISAASEKLYNTWILLGKPQILTSRTKESAFNALGKLYEDENFHLLFYEDIFNEAPLYCEIPKKKLSSPVFYQLTSGSTGTPKCIIENHDNIIQHIICSATFNKYHDGDISLNWIPIDHVVPIITYHFRDVLLGCDQIHVSTPLILSQPLKWFELIERYAVSITWAPNFGYKLIVDAAHASNAYSRKYNLHSIRYFMNAGEQVTSMVMQEFSELLIKSGTVSSTIQPAFGMAEVATCMTYNNNFNCEDSIVKIQQSSLQNQLLFAQSDDFFSSFINLGPPIPTCEIRIIGQDNIILPELKIGMLQIKGPMISGGYYLNETANFTFHNDGWFTTGDLGFVYDSCLFITGREKETIIIRGQNFFCYEIEDTINKISGVKKTFSAAISFYSENEGSEKLVIFFVLDEAIGIEYKDIVDNIRAAIFNGFSINPRHIIDIPINNFPKTSSGKIQRAALKKQFVQGHYYGKTRMSDQNNNLPICPELVNILEDEMFRQLANIWCYRLKLRNFDKNCGFIELGGDSLSAINIVMDVAEKLKIKLSIGDLLTCQTFNLLLCEIRLKAQIKESQAMRRQHRITYPLSMDQARILYQCALGKSRAYSVYKFYEIKGLFLLEEFKGVLLSLLSYFPVLKTYLIEAESDIFQVLHDYNLEAIFTYYDKTSKIEMYDLVKAEIEKDINLFDERPLIGIKLFSINDSLHYLLFNLHHLICDEWSLKLMVEFLSDEYSKKIKHKRMMESLEFGDFIVSQLSLKQGMPENFFKQIKRSHRISLDTAPPNTDEFSVLGSIIIAKLSKKVFLKLKEIAKKNKVTPAILFHSLFGILLHFLSGLKEINIGIPVTYRDDPLLRDTFGFLLNTSVIGSLLDNNESSIDNYIHQIRENYFSAQACRNIPYSEVLKSYNAGQKEYSDSLFHIMFVYEDHINHWEIPGLKFEEKLIHNSTTKFYCTLMVRFLNKNSPILCLEYSTDFITKPMAKKMLLHLKEIIYRFVELSDLQVPIVSII